VDNDKGWSPSSEIGRKLTTLHREKKKKLSCYEMLHRVSDLDGLSGCIFHTKYYYGDQIKDDETKWTCSMNGRDEK
jgi:hypothetical protein